LAHTLVSSQTLVTADKKTSYGSSLAHEFMHVDGTGVSALLQAVEAALAA